MKNFNISPLIILLSIPMYLLGQVNQSLNFPFYSEKNQSRIATELLSVNQISNVHNLHSPEPSEQIPIYKAFKEKQSNTISLRQPNNSIIWIPVQVHIAKSLSGFAASSTYTIDQYLHQINNHLAPANIQLYRCQTDQYIQDDNIYNLSRNNRSSLDTYSVPNAMNLYFVNTYSNYCGEGEYPGVGDKIIYATRCFGFTPTTVLTHLVGQFFSLYPTHGTSSTAAELVNGSNCTTAGDEICDTPADPNLWTSGYNSTTCQYMGTEMDANLAPYTPDSNNFMSYATGGCRDHFSPQQLSRLYQGASVDRAYLTGCSPAVCASPINQFPYQEGFESGWNGWQQMDLDYFDFSLNFGSTPTSGTGPNVAAEGIHYIYAEATGNFYGTGILSPCFDLSQLTTPTLRFQCHMNGLNIARLGVQVSLDGGILWQGIGNDPFVYVVEGDQGNNWQSHQVDLSSFANSTSLRFRFIAILNSGDDLQDIAIDDINLSNGCFERILTTNPVSCYTTEDGSASLQILNAPTNLNSIWSTGDSGPSIQNLAPGNYSVTTTDGNSCTVVDNFTIQRPDSLYINLLGQDPNNTNNNNGVIESTTYGGIPPYTYTWSDGNASTNFRLNLPVGHYGVTVTDANSCSYSTSIYLSVYDPCNGTKSNWPYQQDFEGNTGLFKQDNSDHRNWKKKTGNTPTSTTGPSAALEGNYYRYVESSGKAGHPHKAAVLTTKKCLDLSGLNVPELSFSYHMKGIDMGKMAIQIHNGTGWMNSIWEREGAQGSDWQQALINLTDLQNAPIRIRIVGITGSGPRSDIAIDDLWIKDSHTNSSWIAPEVALKQTAVSSTPPSLQSFQLFPNPAQNEVFIEFNENQSVERSIFLLDSQGTLIKKIQSLDQQIRISLENLPTGLYYISMASAIENKQIQKLVITN